MKKYKSFTVKRKSFNDNVRTFLSEALIIELLIYYFKKTTSSSIIIMDKTLIHFDIHVGFRLIELQNIICEWKSTIRSRI